MILWQDEKELWKGSTLLPCPFWKIQIECLGTFHTLLLKQQYLCSIYNLLDQRLKTLVLFGYTGRNSVRDSLVWWYWSAELKLTKMLTVCRKKDRIWSLAYKRRLVNLQNLFVNSKKEEVARDIYFTCLFDRRSRLPTIIRWLSLEQRKFCYISPTQNTAFVSCQVYHSLQKCFSTFEFIMSRVPVYFTTTSNKDQQR